MGSHTPKGIDLNIEHQGCGCVVWKQPGGGSRVHKVLIVRRVWGFEMLDRRVKLWEEKG